MRGWQHEAPQFSSAAQSCPTLCDPMDCSTPGLPVHHQLPEFTQTHVHRVGNAIQLSHPLSSPSPSAFNLSQHQDLFFSFFLFFNINLFILIGGWLLSWVFSNKSVLLIRWPEYLHFSFSISPSNEYSGLISFRMDWFDLLEVQGTLKSFLQCHSWKVSIIWRSAFFMVQFSHPYMTSGKKKKTYLWLNGPLLAKYYLCFLICCLFWS